MLSGDRWAPLPLTFFRRTRVEQLQIFLEPFPFTAAHLLLCTPARPGSTVRPPQLAWASRQRLRRNDGGPPVCLCLSINKALAPDTRPQPCTTQPQARPRVLQALTARLSVRLLPGFDPGSAVALSNITIVGGALSNFLFNVRRRHPSGTRPLIDWDLIMVMEPSTILGALLGGYLNKVPSVCPVCPFVFPAPLPIHLRRADWRRKCESVCPVRPLVCLSAASCLAAHAQGACPSVVCLYVCLSAGS
jgi:hypothetical protein